MITPLCSQLAYKGLLDEFLGVNNGAMEVDSSIMGIQQEGKKIKVPLNSTDKLFKEIRDLNFEVVVQCITGASAKSDIHEAGLHRYDNHSAYKSCSFLGHLDMEPTIVEAQSYDMISISASKLSLQDNLKVLTSKKGPQEWL
ncbi:hypothetical protein ACH5RR_018903, partial [Cinchona calisaya]